MTGMDEAVCAACGATDVLLVEAWTHWDDDPGPVRRLVCDDAKACNGRRRRRPGRPVDGPGVQAPTPDGENAAAGRTGAGNRDTW